MASTSVHLVYKDEIGCKLSSFAVPPEHCSHAEQSPEGQKHLSSHCKGCALHQNLQTPALLVSAVDTLNISRGDAVVFVVVERDVAEIVEVVEVVKMPMEGSR